MNLRILKKLSKRAAPLLPLLGDGRKQFRAEPFDNYTGLNINARKHFERFRSPHPNLIRPGEIKRLAKDGRGYVGMWPTNHPRKGTIMVGAISGYYEPEWDEKTAWEAFAELVYWHFVDDSNEELRPTRRLATPAQIFRAANEIIFSSSPALHVGGR